MSSLTPDSKNFIIAIIPWVLARHRTSNILRMTTSIFAVSHLAQLVPGKDESTLKTQVPTFGNAVPTRRAGLRNNILSSTQFQVASGNLSDDQTTRWPKPASGKVDC